MTPKHQPRQPLPGGIITLRADRQPSGLNALLLQMEAALDRKAALSAKSNPAPKPQRTPAERAAAEAKVAELEAERASLRQQLDALENRPRGFASKIRFAESGFNIFTGERRQRQRQADTAKVAELQAKVDDLEKKLGNRERKGLASRIRFAGEK